jgi:hypothetical protein
MLLATQHPTPTDDKDVTTRLQEQQEQTTVFLPFFLSFSTTITTTTTTTAAATTKAAAANTTTTTPPTFSIKPDTPLHRLPLPQCQVSEMALKCFSRKSGLAIHVHPSFGYNSGCTHQILLLFVLKSIYWHGKGWSSRL